MRIVCPICGSAVPVEDVDLSTKLAKCRGCNEVFAIGPLLGAASAEVAPHSGPMLPPPGITFERRVPPPDDRPTAFRELAASREPGTLTIRRRWFEAQHVFLLFFCIAWDAFLVNWYGMAFAGDAPLIMVVFPIAHVAVGVGLTYYVLAGFLNRTTIEVTDGMLLVRHGPMPWRGNLRVPVAALRSVYVKATTSTGSKGHVSVRHSVVADTDVAIESPLLALTDSTQAEFIAAALAEHLGVPTRATLFST